MSGVLRVTLTRRGRDMETRALGVRICHVEDPNPLPRGPTLIAYPATLDVPTELVRYLSGLLRTERRRRGTRENTRLISCWKQAVFVLAWFRKKDDIAVLGAGFGLSRETAYLHHAESVKVLPAQAPDLAQTLERVKAESWAYLILDGTVETADRTNCLGTLYAAATQGLPTLADGGYLGAGIGVHVPVKQPGDTQTLDIDNRTDNALPRGLRTQGE
jgi:hypothetical protein